MHTFGSQDPGLFHFVLLRVSSFRLSSGGALIQAIMDGLHVFGILKSFGVSEDEDEATEIASSPLGWLNGLSGLEKKAVPLRTIWYMVLGRTAEVKLAETDFER